ncbi:MAG: dTMP kinase [Tissierellia bacterium]|nr:dTMP kinase [Tissierellia bacterium]
MKGKFIVFEGADGSGKTTVLELVRKELEKSGIRPVMTREPGGTILSEKIRDLLLDADHGDLTPEAEALLYAAARIQHVKEKILPAIQAGELVICDRYIPSSLVYQGIARGLGVESVEELNRYALESINVDLTLYLAVDAAHADSRRSDRGQRDRLELEGDAFHKSVREGYEAVVKSKKNRYNIYTIDANQSAEAVCQDCLVQIRMVLQEE